MNGTKCSKFNKGKGDTLHILIAGGKMKLLQEDIIHVRYYLRAIE